MMPERIARTPIPRADLRVHRLRPVRVRARAVAAGREGGLHQVPGYKPRSEPPSGLAGGKVAKVDRVEWIWIPDAQTQVNALINGEIDLIEAPPHDLLPLLEGNDERQPSTDNPLGNQYMFRLNRLYKPFDNPKIRQAALVGAQPRGFPARRRSAIPVLQDLHGDVHLRHAARDRRRAERPAEVGFRRARAAPQGGGLRRHAGRADALDRPRGR